MRSPADILSDSESIRVRIPSLPYESKYFLTGQQMICLTFALLQYSYAA